MRKTWSFFSIFCLLFFIYTNTVFASNLTLKQYPESPKEGEEVKITLDSDKYDLNIANITWTVDGQEVDNGIGRKTLTLKTSSNGLGQVIAAKVEQEGYDNDQVQKVVEANTNFILYEGSDSYVPPFYKGRRLPAKEGKVRATFFSFKDGEIVGLNTQTPDNYIWKINGEEKKDFGGQNKIINDIQTKVTDTSLNIQILKQDQNLNAKTSQVLIPLQNTEVIVYKTDEKKLLKQTLSDTEIGKNIYLLVEPFFFSVPNKKSTILSYIWKINDLETKVLTPWSVVFTGKNSDSVQINLNVLNNQKITQENSRGFTFKVK